MRRFWTNDDAGRLMSFSTLHGRRNREHSRKNVADRKRRESVAKQETIDDDEEWTEETEQRSRNRGEKGRSTKGKCKTKAAGAGWSGRKGGSTFSRAPLSPGSSSSWGSISPSRDEEGEVIARPRVRSHTAVVVVVVLA